MLPETIGSLFSGIGGLELGLERATGARTIWNCEIEPFCRRVLAKHWPHAKQYEDVKAIDDQAEVPDLICGGFPCQDLSVAGTREGLEGEKSGLWHEYARILRVLRPRYVFVENVTALRHFVSDGGMGRVLGDLVQSGYDAEWDCVPAVAVGASHVRDRIFILGWRRDMADTESDRRGPRSRGGMGAVAADSDGPAAREDRSRRSVADTDEAGRAERRGSLAATTTQGAAERGGRDASRGFDFPPPPASPRWIEWLERHPGAQPGLRRGDDGFSSEMVRTRRRRLRALGNAVVPQAAERAWELLFRRAQEHL